MKGFMHAYYWLLDYLYVAKVYVCAFSRRVDARTYRNEGAPSVMLLPGVYETWRFMEPIAKALHEKGFDVHVVEAFKYNTGTIEAMAALAATYAQNEKLQNTVIVTHSKGGLIGKQLLMMTEGSKIFSKLIALNAPFTGSTYAYLLPLPSLRVFTPNSKIIRLLTKNVSTNSRIVSIYGLFDPHIPGGSRLEGAQNVVLPTYGHFRILADINVHAALLEAINA